VAYYIVAHYTIHDLPAWQAYAPPAIATIGQYDGKILAATGPGLGEATVIERTPQHAVTILLEFASQAAMERWYHSPEYQALVGQRIDATDGWTIGLPPFAPPA
jgi:uncharacterized protein (DUF1330 family)